MFFFHLKLRAIDLEQNINRDYEIFVSKVFFNCWGVTLAFGRYGTKGTYKNYVFSTKEEAQQFVHKTIQKRLKAPKRIGCPYRVISAKTSQEEPLCLWFRRDQEKVLANN